MADQNMTPQQWRQLCHEVTVAMEVHVAPHLTPISRAITHNEGELQGSGSYIEFEGKRLLITNEHVLPVESGAQFTHQFWNCEDVFRLDESIAAERHPVDVAICAIADEVWTLRAHAGMAIPVSRFARRHKPVDRELLFLMGYPESRSRFLFGTLVSRSTPLLTQEPIPKVAGLHTNQFAVAYNPEGGERIDGSTLPLPQPKGMSGSLVWNTRRVEYLVKDMAWTPDVAQVTGILCRWSSPDLSVIATRVETILDFLNRHAATLA